MAKPKSPLLSLGARGTIGDMLTFQQRLGGSIVRKKPVPKDPRTEAQLARRQIYRDAVADWHALTQEEKEAYRGVCPGLTAYQCFMRSALVAPEPPPPPEEQTEEQTQHSMDTDVWYPSWPKKGQRLFITNRKVTKLGFWLKKRGDTPGDVTFQIRKVSGDVLIMEKVLCDGNDLPVELTYHEVTFDTPTIVNEEVRIAIVGVAGDINNCIFLRAQAGDVKANEKFTMHNGTSWSDYATYDTAYRYKYYEV